MTKPYRRPQHAPTGVDLERFVIALGKTIGVDFDGTLHPYTNGWTGSEPDDEPPIPGALAFLEGLLADGYDIAIFSCRADHLDGEQGIIRWLHKHMRPIFYAMRESQGKRVTVTDRKPPAIAYVDDRAVPFNGSWDLARFAVDQLAARAHGAAPPAPGAEREPVKGRLPAYADSNLDLLGRAEHDFEDPLRCPCLPAVEVGCADGQMVLGRFLHDAVAARVLRAENGHP